MNPYNARDYQIWTAAHGFNPGPIDGIWGRRTEAAVVALMGQMGVSQKEAIFPKHGLTRIQWHWTGGAEGVIDLELNHYNFVIDHGGEVLKGKYDYTKQASYAIGKAASHTLHANSHAIGIGVDAMAGAVERPFNEGTNPMNQKQVESLVMLTAKLCKELGIPVSRWTTLSHAEVQPTLGIRQRFKWDIMWLPGMKSVGDPVEIGDKLRDMVRDAM